MSSRQELRQHGLVSKVDELVFTRNVDFSQSLTIDKSLVVEPGTISKLYSDVNVAGNIIKPAWGFRRYITFTMPLDAGSAYRDFVVPSSCFIRIVRSVVDGDPGINVVLKLWALNPFHASTDNITITNGSPAGEKDLWVVDLTDPDDLIVATCGANSSRSLVRQNVSVNPVVAYFLIELYDLKT